MVSHALEVLYRTMIDTGSTVSLHDHMVDFDGYMEVVGLAALRETEARYERG
jgi:hypothetical protein